MLKQPFLKSWWVVEGKLLAGCFPGTPEPGGIESRLRSLVDAGIRTFISLQPADERNTRTNAPFPEYETILRRLQEKEEQRLTFHRFGIQDYSAPTLDLTVSILDAIDRSLAQDRPVYVHCWGGHGRTGTIIGCWLVRHGESGENVLKQLKRLRSNYPELAGEPAPQSESQRQLVLRWASLDPHRKRVGAELKPPPANAAAGAVTQGSSTLLIGIVPASLHDRYLGAMFGLAVGDAVGTTLEFKSPGTFAPINDMVGGGPFALQKGQWTDDTSMALCLAESLVHQAANDPADQMARYVAWWKQGHLSSTGRCFDIGNATRAALARFLDTNDPMSGSDDPHSAGNGSLMRLAPIPLVFRADVNVAVEAAALSSKTTHAAKEAVDACRFMTVLLICAVGGMSKEELLSKGQWERSLHAIGPLAPKVQVIADGSYKGKSASEIRGSGYVVDCLEAALWAFYHHGSYAEAVLAAANLGDDADTTAAVCGQIAGAFHGISGIPLKWVNEVALRDTIAELTLGLLVLSNVHEFAGN